MNKYFSIGELAKLQNISRQTLIFYDTIVYLSQILPIPIMVIAIMVGSNWIISIQSVF